MVDAGAVGVAGAVREEGGRGPGVTGHALGVGVPQRSAKAGQRLAKAVFSGLRDLSAR